MALMQDEKENDTPDTDILHKGNIHTKLINNLEALLATALPRLRILRVLMVYRLMA